MRLFLVRHASYEPGYFGEEGPPLSPKGLAEARALGITIRQLAPDGFRRAIISSLRRTAQTLQALEVQHPPPIDSPLAFDVGHSEEKHRQLDALIGSDPGNVLLVGHEYTCKNLCLRYDREFQLGLGKQPFNIAELAVVDFLQRSITRY